MYKGIITHQCPLPPLTYVTWFISLLLKIIPRGGAYIWQSRNPAKTIFGYGSLLRYSLILDYVLDNWTVAVKSWRPAYIDRSVLRADALGGHAKRSVGQLNNIQTSSAFIVSTLM